MTGARVGLVSALALIAAGCGSKSSVHTFFDPSDVDTTVTEVTAVLDTVLSTAGEVVSNRAIQAAGVVSAYEYIDPSSGAATPLTGVGSVVAIMSDGVDGTHAELQGKIIGGYNTALDNAAFAPTVRHLCVARINPGVDDCDPGTYGTEMAGVIAASANGTGIQGLAPNARLFAINAADEENDFGINGDANPSAYDQALTAGAKIFVHGYGKSVDYTQEDEMRDPETELIKQLIRTAATGATHVYGGGSVRQSIWEMTDWENNGRPNLQGELPLWHSALRNGALIMATSGYAGYGLSRGGMSEDTETALLNWLTDPSVDGGEHARRRAAVDAVVTTDADGVDTLVSYDRSLFAMSGDAAWCKGAAMWCLVVTPASTNLVASDGLGTFHQNEDADQSGYTGGWTHGNNAAAVVAGAMALVKQAFPYLTEHQIAEILLDAADYVAPEHSDIAVYSEGGVLANEKYGRGLLNVANALRPAGQTAFALGDSLDTARMLSVADTGVTLGGVLAGASASFARPLVFFDKYGRAFPIDASALASDDAGFEAGLDRLSRVLGLTGGMVAMAPEGFESLQFGRETLASDDWHAGYGGEASFRLGAGTVTMGFSPSGAMSGIAGAGALLGRSEADPFRNGHLSFTENEAAATVSTSAGWGGKVSFGAGLSSDPDNESRIVAHRFAADYAQPLGEKTALGLHAGYMGRSDGSVLGTDSRGAFALADSTETAFMEATLTHRLTDKLALVGQAQWGRSWIDASGLSMARIDGPLDTGALRLGIDARSAFTAGDRLSLSAGTALHPVSGTLQFDYATGRAADGTLITESHRVDLAGSRPPLEMRVDYSAPLSSRTDVGVTAALRDEAGQSPEGDIFLGLTTRF